MAERKYTGSEDLPYICHMVDTHLFMVFFFHFVTWEIFNLHIKIIIMYGRFLNNMVDRYLYRMFIITYSILFLPTICFKECIPHDIYL